MPISSAPIINDLPSMLTSLPTTPEQRVRCRATAELDGTLRTRRRAFRVLGLFWRPVATGLQFRTGGRVSPASGDRRQRTPGGQPAAVEGGRYPPLGRVCAAAC